MAIDELTRPLGLRQRRGIPVPRLPRGLIVPLAAFAVIAVAAAAAVLFLPAGSEAPAVTVPIDSPPAATAGTAGEVSIRAASTGDGAGISITTPDGRPAEGSTIRPGFSPVAVSFSATPEPGLTESSQYGPIPVTAASGRRPFDAYARPVDLRATDNRPRIAIVVGGLGIGAAGTERAIQTLPGEVTLAFAPYGDGLMDWAARARADGHELLLQLPMEPFDYPTVNPGPRTLLTDAPVAQNLDSLAWLMARLPAYAGVISYAGGRFTGEPEALQPLLAELGRRGLLYVDDGSSTRSRAAATAPGVLPFAKADLVIDTVTQPTAIAGRLTQLETIARERGYAVGSASAYAATVSEIAAWAATLGDRGFVLVPVTSLADDPASAATIRIE